MNVLFNDPNERHVMIDSETLSTSNNGVIWQIGAVEWFPGRPHGTCEETLRAFNAHISLESSFAAGRVVDPSTIMYWMGAETDAREAFILGQQNAIAWRDALQLLSEWIVTDNGRQGMSRTTRAPDAVWSHGAAFDLAMLEEGYRRARMKCPWDYNAQRDTRTIFAMSGQSLHKWYTEEDRVNDKLIAHNAVDDSIAQITGLMRAINHLRDLSAPKEEGQ